MSAPANSSSVPTTEAGKRLTEEVFASGFPTVLAVAFRDLALTIEQQAAAEAVARERERLEAPLRRILRASDAYRDALNGLGHPGEPHDRVIHMDPCTADPTVHVYSDATDCAACGGAQYGTEDALQQALVAAKVLLGEQLLPWEDVRARWLADEEQAALLESEG